MRERIYNRNNASIFDQGLLPILNGATGVGWWAERDYIAKLIPFREFLLVFYVRIEC